MHADMNRQVRLVARPRGIPQAEHFALVTEPVATPGEGEILIRNHYLSVDPAQRGWANDEGNYSAPVPLNSPMRALAVGEILKSNAAGFHAGEFVYGWFGWQTCCVATPEAVLRRVNPSALPLSANLGLLGINGLTAYLALHRLGDPKPGEHVLVSTAAGSVGSFVGTTRTDIRLPRRRADQFSRKGRAGASPLRLSADDQLSRHHRSGRCDPRGMP